MCTATKAHAGVTLTCNNAGTNTHKGAHTAITSAFWGRTSKIAWTGADVTLAGTLVPNLGVAG